MHDDHGTAHLSTVDQYRLTQLERQVETMVDRAEFDELKADVRKLRDAVGRLPLWFVGTALSIVTVLVALRGVHQ